MILSGNDAFDPFANNPTAREQWEEHQRRQRSTRFLMTFIMMLILLDGDQESAARNAQQSRSNLRPKKATGPGPVHVLDKGLWDLRRGLDGQVMEVAERSERFETLLGLNDGVNEEKLIWEEVRTELEEEARKGEKKDGDEDDTKMKRGKSDIPTFDELEEEMEKEERLIWHYPRNATGYYKGEWKCLSQESNEQNDEEGSEAVSSSPSPPIRDNETYHGPLRPLSELEILHQLKGSNHLAQTAKMGLFFLPNGTQLPLSSDDLNSTDFTWNEDDQHSSSQQEQQKQQLPPLEITKSSGKVYFHFYRRLIPGMTSLSLLDGYLKLGDVNDAGFASPRKNLLIRVQGIMIHALGKISLVANDFSDVTGSRYGRRHAFLLFANEGSDDEKEKDEIKGKDKAQEESHDPIQEDETRGGQIQEERRRLLEMSIQNVLDSTTTSTTTTIQMGTESSLHGVERLRQEALSSYSHLFDKHVVGGKDWKEHSSSFQPHELASLLSNHGTSPVYDPTMSSDQRRRLENKTDESKEGKDESTPSFNTTSSVNKTLHFSLESHFHPFPYVPDDEDERQSLSNLPLKMESDSPPEILFEHGLECEFEIDMDIQQEQWSYLDYRTMLKRLLMDLDSMDPHADKEPKKSSPSYPKSRKEKDYVMGLTGTITSPNCNFTSSLNVTAIRPDWEKVGSKAVNYCFIMMIACFVQIIVLFRQLIHTQRQSMAIRVSMISIGWQTVLDAMMCISHILLCMILQPVSTAFAMVAFFKLIIFCVIEMKYMVIILQNRSNAEGNTLNSEELRRKVALLHFRFYCALILTNIFLWNFGDYKKICFLFMFSFWVPQIMLNVYTETKDVLHKHYIYGMSVTRLIAPLYFYAVPNNFLKEHDPDFGPLDPVMCQLLFLYVGLQCGILIAQNKYGPRFMIPARFLPPKYDYHRPVPESLLPVQVEPAPNKSPDESIESTSSLLGNEGIVGENLTTGTRNRKEKRNHDDSNGGTIIEETETPCCKPTLECVICYNSIRIEDKRNYMLAPCGHIFHRTCLEQWMEVKMECPICRMELPAV